MHLTELIENNTCVAVALQTFSDGEGKTYELSAVKFKGWITVNGAVKDGVRILDRLFAKLCTSKNRQVVKKGTDNNCGDIKDALSAFCAIGKAEEYFKDAVVIAYEEKEARDFFDFLGLTSGAGARNKTLYVSDIAYNNYRDKIRDYSFGALAARFGGKTASAGALGRAETVAEIFARLALEDDIAHCGY